MKEKDIRSFSQLDTIRSFTRNNFINETGLDEANED